MKVLLIARDYPPTPAGGARRPFLFAQALRSAGADVFVCAPDLPADEHGVRAPHSTPTPLEDVEIGTPDLARWTVRDWGRELLRWPDPDSAWSMQAARTALAAVPFKPDWVLTSSPPESLLKAGLHVKGATGARWVADFRDTWLSDPRRPARRLLWKRAGERLFALGVLGRTDRLSAVDEVVAREISTLAGGAAVSVVRQLRPPPTKCVPLEPSNLIHLVYTGQISLGDSRRTADQLLRPVEAAHAVSPRFLLHVAGHLTADEGRRLAEAKAPVQRHGPLSFEAVRSLQSGADALLVIGSEGSTAVPGKLAEYRAVGAPIIAIGGGPWRGLAGLPEGDPVEALLALGKYEGGATHQGTDPEREKFLGLFD